ncbi:hypothetical protein [Nostoc sp.]|uniref:hypothetical protein n=1 Tax=Nostoc sp. TaxID=1180 RepID=UPI002FF4A5A1
MRPSRFNSYANLQSAIAPSYPKYSEEWSDTAQALAEELPNAESRGIAIAH